MLYARPYIERVATQAWRNRLCYSAIAGAIDLQDYNMLLLHIILSVSGVLCTPVPISELAIGH